MSDWLRDFLFFLAAVALLVFSEGLSTRRERRRERLERELGRKEVDRIMAAVNHARRRICRFCDELVNCIDPDCAADTHTHDECVAAHHARSRNGRTVQ